MIDTKEPIHDVVAEVLAGTGLSLGQAARRFPPYRQSRPVNPSTIFRWVSEGIRLPDGSRLRLEACRVSGRWLTSVPAVERFLRRQTPQLDRDLPQTPRTLPQRQRAAERAGKELEKIGI